MTFPQAVLFDMDGLLVDSEPLWFEAESAVMARLGGPWTAADQQALLGGSLEHSVSYLMAKARAAGTVPSGTPTSPHAPGPTAGVPAAPSPAAPSPAAPSPTAPSTDEVARWLLDGMTRLITARGLPLLPGAGELLAEVAAAGIPHALVTSSQRQIMHTVLAVTGMRFPVTVCGDDVRRGKPHPEPYLRAAELLGADPRCCVALEDSPNGIASAESAGCVVIAVPSTPVPVRPGRVTVSSLRELDLARLRALAAGVSTAVCDDEGEGGRG